MKQEEDLKGFKSYGGEGERRVVMIGPLGGCVVA